MKASDITNEIIVSILKTYAKSNNIEKSCKLNNIPYFHFKNKMKQIGAKLWKPNLKTSSDLRSMVVDLYNKNISSRKIGSMLCEKYEATAILKVLREERVTLRNEKFDYKNNVNHHCFKKINSDEAAYFLGLLLADGSLSATRKQVTLGLQEGDSYLVDKFLDFCFKGEKKGVRIREKADPNHQNCYVGIVCSEEVFNDLIVYGCGPQKDFTAKIELEKINKKFHGAILRGIFDGDGCITTNKYLNGRYEVKFATASEEMKKSILHILEKNNISRYIHEEKNRGTAFSIDIQGENELIKLFDLMYRGSSIFMRRKFEKFIRHLVHRKKRTLNKTRKQKEGVFMGIRWIKTKSMYRILFNGHTIGYHESKIEAAKIFTDYKLKNCKDTYCKPDQINWVDYSELEDLVDPKRILKDMGIYEKAISELPEIAELLK